jgi:hypothetical protein
MNEKNSGKEAGGGAKPPSRRQRQNQPDTYAYRARKYARRAERRIRRHGPTIEIVSAAVVATFTIALSFVGYWQYRTSKQATDAAKQANAVAVAAMKSTREMTAADQRPWVLFDPTPPSAKHYFNSATQSSVRLHITNFGKGPALRARWSLWSLANPNDAIWKTTAIPHRGWARSRGETTLAPGDTTQIDVGWEHGFPAPRQVPAKGSTVHVLLLVRYFDTFGGHHRTLICVGGGSTSPTRTRCTPV